MRRPTLPKWRPTLPAWAHALHTHMSRVEQIALAWLLVVLVVSALFSLTGYINRHTHLIPQNGGTYTEGAVGQPRLLNPILAGANDLDVDITRLVYSSLFRLDTKLQLKNDLAANYELSADQKLYTIRLRPDVHWHDGTPFTADDVVFTIRSIQTPDYGSPLLSAFQGVDIQKIDAHTVTFKLSQPYAPFLYSLTVGIMPQHVWGSIAPKNAALAEQSLKPIGTGPYQFTELTTRRRTGEITAFHLTRNTGYYGTYPYIDEIVFTFYPTHEEAVAAWLSGEVDGVGFLPLTLLADASQRRSAVVHRLLLPQYFGLFFNQTKNDILADTTIRQALSQATDRETIVKDALRGEGEALALPIPPGLITPIAPPASLQYDPDAAKQSLEAAGWRDADNDGIREKDNRRLHLKITTTDWPEYVRTAELVQHQWRVIGVETEIQHLGAGTIQQTAVRPREYEVLLFGEILSAQPDPYPFWHSTQTRNPGLNFSLLKNEQIDKLLEEARKTLDVAAREQKLHAFQEQLAALKPAIILYRPNYLFATTTKVHNTAVDLAALPSDRFNNIEQWHVRTRRVLNTQ